MQMDLDDMVAEIQNQFDEYENVIEELKKEKCELNEKVDMLEEALTTRKDDWVVFDGKAYLESIDEDGNVTWTPNKYEAVRKSTMEEAVLLAQRANVPITLRVVE